MALTCLGVPVPPAPLTSLSPWPSPEMLVTRPASLVPGATPPGGPGSTRSMSRSLPFLAELSLPGCAQAWEWVQPKHVLGGDARAGPGEQEVWLITHFLGRSQAEACRRWGLGSGGKEGGDVEGQGRGLALSPGWSGISWPGCRARTPPCPHSCVRVVQRVLEAQRVLCLFPEPPPNHGGGPSSQGAQALLGEGEEFAVVSLTVSLPG